MPTKTAANVANVSVRGALGGQLVETGLYYLFDAAIDDSALATLLASISTAVIAHWLPNLPTGWVGREVYGFDMTSGATLQMTDTSVAGHTGSIGTAPEANNVTIAVARKSGKRGRSTQGRVYWPGLDETQLASTTTLLSAAATAIVAALTDTDAAAEADGWTPVTLSFQHAGVVSPAAVISPIVQWIVTDLRLDSARRRLAGRGV